MNSALVAPLHHRCLGSVALGRFRDRCATPIAGREPANAGVLRTPATKSPLARNQRRLGAAIGMPTVVFLHFAAVGIPGVFRKFGSSNIDASLRIHVPGWSYWLHTIGTATRSAHIAEAGFSSQSWHILCSLRWPVIAADTRSDSFHPNPMLRIGLLFGVICFVQGMNPRRDLSRSPTG